MQRPIHSVLAAAAAGFFSLVATAHVGISSGPGYAGTSQIVTFGVGHGCEGADTMSVEVEIPEGVLSVRPENSSLGDATVTRNDAGDVTLVKWEKLESSVREVDEAYYRLNLRFKVPDAPFTSIFLPAHQTCMAADGTVTVVDWVGTSGDEKEEPAPALVILPPHMAGWNKFIVPAAIADLATYFSDAVIVWKGNSAYSANPNTLVQILDTDGVKELTKLAAGDEIWVKY